MRLSDSMIGPAVIAINMTALVDNIVDDTIVPELEKERFIGSLTAARGSPFKGIMIAHDRPLFWVIANPEISPRGRPHRKEGGSGPPGNAPRYCRGGGAHVTLLETEPVWMKVIPTPVTVKNVMDYTLLDEVLKEKR